MKFSENWLRELVPLTADRDTLVERLTMSGLEVEAVESLGDDLAGVVVGEIVAIAPHPDADRLRVCEVNAGGEALTIVCGAPNARAGLKAPLATVGAKLPGGMVIKPARLRGVESFGMLCSARELGLAEDAGGLLELPADAAVGAPLADCLGLPDAAIEVSLTPNRPDCLGMLGLARDVAAQFDRSFTPAAQAAAVPVATGERQIRIEAGADCPRYLGRVIESVDTAAPTPGWMVRRLQRAGLRAHNLIVDVTNYVLLELGQPLHAFDNARLAGAVQVRRARRGEQLVLLDGATINLDERHLVIADDAAVLALAGVMGGMGSRVTDATRDIFLESAHFAPAAIMGRARDLGLHTDASHRFERGVDPELPERALERATELFVELAGGGPGPVCRAEEPAAMPARASVELRRTRLARVLGVAVPDARVEAILANLGLAPESLAEGWRVQVPSWRFDIEREEDLIEEVARIHGYREIPVRMPAGELVLAVEPEARLAERAPARQAIARGYREAVCMAFTSRELLADWACLDATLALANPLSADQAVMRPSLLPGLVQALQRNLSRQQERVRLFERGRVFRQGAAAGEVLESDRLALTASGSAHAEQWGRSRRAVDFHDLKGDVESILALAGDPQAWTFDALELPPWLHPGKGARILRDGRPCGLLGELHPRLQAALDLGETVLVAELELEVLRERRIPQAQPVARFPRVRRDLAVEVPRDLPWSRVAACVRGAAGPWLVELGLFDQYQGSELDPGRKSLAMGLILQDRSRTLTDDEVDACVARVVAALGTECAGRLRG